MSLVIDKTDIRALKEFARTMSWAFPVIFGIALPWLFNYSWQYWPLGITIVLMSLHWLSPQAIFYPFKIWMTLVSILGWINTRVILGLSFYLLIAPIGMFLRLFGKLQYRTNIDNNRKSNYVLREESPDKQSLENPF